MRRPLNNLKRTSLTRLHYNNMFSLGALHRITLVMIRAYNMIVYVFTVFYPFIQNAVFYI